MRFRMPTMDGVPWTGHLKEFIVLPSLMAAGAIWPLIPTALRERWTGRDRDFGRPVLCLPGYAHNASSFVMLAKRLSAAGIGPMHCISYKPMLASLETHAARLAEAVQHLLERSDADRVALLGHSMGGLVARHYLQEMGGIEKVDRFVTIETPHQGLKLARFGLGECARQMHPAHPFMQRLLDGAGRLRGLPVLAIYSNVNPLSARSPAYRMLDGRSDCFVPGEGHASLLLARPVADRIISFLNGHIDHG